MSKKPAIANPAPLGPDHALELRQVEDQWLGHDAPRTADGKVERGHGSLLTRLTPARRRHHEALEKAVAAGAKHSQAAAVLAAAKAELDVAAKHVAQTWTN